MATARASLALALAVGVASVIGVSNAGGVTVTPALPPRPLGDVAAVHALLERVLPGSSSRFALSLTASCPGVAAGAACFTLADGADGASTTVAATTSAELTAGLGVYFREVCNMTIGWARGGASNIFTPAVWPRVGAPVTRARVTPYSYIMNVCTHSYTLVWYDW